jgi:GNAT superfamily N-acetyltransferase
VIDQDRRVADPNLALLSLSQEADIDPEALQGIGLIYEAAFPPSERDEFGRLVDAVSCGAQQLFVARLAGLPVGFALAGRLEGLDAYLLGYIAIDAQMRGQGIGGRLLDFLVAALRRSGAAAGIIFEAESVEHGCSEERALRQRRLDFYRRHGALLIEGAPNYRGPDLSGPGEIHYALMWIPFVPGEQAPSGRRLHDLVRALLVQGYGLEAIAPLVKAVLDDLS